MPTKSSLLRQFKDSLPAWRSQSVLYRYPRLVEHFIDYVGVKQTYTKADAMRFLNHMSQSGMSVNYIRWASYILKTFFESLGLTYPVGSGDLRKPRQGDVIAPVYSLDYIHTLVDAVRTKGSLQMQSYLAISTAYAPRRLEMARLSAKDISNGYINIQTVKGGLLRRHTLFTEITPYLNYKFKPVHEQTLGNVFVRIQQLAGFKHEEREGWHGLRRSLVTELLNNGVPIHITYSFMGWSPGRLGILGTYSKPQPELVDEVVHEHHPFLKLWT